MNIRYQTVMSYANPIPAQNGICEFTEFNRKPIFPEKPFVVFIDDKKLEYGYTKNLFQAYTFRFDNQLLVLKTVNNGYVVLKKDPTNYTYSLFSIGESCVFSEIRDLQSTGDGCKSKLAFSIIERNPNYVYAYQNYKKRIVIHTCNWSHGGIIGIPEAIHSPEGSRRSLFDIVSIFGPFPVVLKEHFDSRFQKDPWWVAYCSDGYYRVFHGTSRLHWIPNKKKTDILKLRQFMPTFTPNYFYALTSEKKELVVRGVSEYGWAIKSWEEAFTNFFQHRRSSFVPNEHQNHTQMFLGQTHQAFREEVRMETPFACFDRTINIFQ